MLYHTRHMAKKKQADTLTTSELAKILGVHPDTIRRRAKAGQYPYTLVKGRMSFSRAALAGKLGHVPGGVAQQVTYAQFVIDRSGSMMHLVSKMEESLGTQLDAMRSAPANVEYRVGALPFGSRVGQFTGWSAVASYPHYSCQANLGNTALYDAMADAITRAELKLLEEPGAAHLIIVVTDGYNNAGAIDGVAIAERVKTSMSSDHITIVINCPPGHESMFSGIGVPAQNIRPWDATEKGVREMTQINTLSLNNYSQARSRGVTVSSNYFVDPGSVDPSTLVKKLDQKMDDVTSDVRVVRVPKGLRKPNDQIRNVAAKLFGAYRAGAVYYELVKKEKVQGNKQIIVQDKTTGKFYHGWDSARKLLNLPVTTGTVNVAPGTLGEFKVFVQSTSYTRRLPADTAIIQYR